MIKAFNIGDDSEKSNKNESLIRAYNEKGLFPFSLDNPSTAFTNNISSTQKKINNKHKLLDFIYGSPPNLFESGQKDYFNSPKDIYGKKRIRQ